MPDQSNRDSGCHSNNSSSSSSDGAPEEFQVAMDTNENNLWTKDVMDEKLGKTFDFTVMILSFRTDRFGQTVQTQIRLLLEGQSDQGRHCLLLHLHLFEEKP